MVAEHVICMYPEREDFPELEEPPEGYGGWNEGTCRHLYCLEAQDARRTMPARIESDLRDPDADSPEFG
jgi:hypothetical protein